MAQNYSWNPNIGAVNGYGNVPCQNVRGTKLAATTDTSLTVPNIVATGNIRNTVPLTGADTGLIYARIKYDYNATVWVANNAAATPDTTGTFATVNGALLPECLLVRGGDVLHFYAAAGANVTVEFYPWQA